MNDLMRFLSVENATIFNVFCDEIERSKLPQSKHKFKMARVVERIPDRDQSGVTRILTKLNEKSYASLKSALFVQNAGQYVLLPLGVKILEFTRNMSSDYDEIKEAADASNDNSLRIAVNTFSFHSLIKIEHELKSKNPGIKYERVFASYRSHEIESNVATNPTIDFGITERLVPPSTNSNDLESCVLSSKPLQLISKVQLTGALDDTIPTRGKSSEGVVGLSALRRMPLLLGDSINFLDLLLGLGEDDKDVVDRLRELPKSEKKKFVRSQYRISDMSSSLNFLMDMFLIENTETYMIVTPEVNAHIQAMNNTKYLAMNNPNWEKKHKLHLYDLPTKNGTIHKYAFRKTKPSSKQIAQDFWAACKSVEMNNRAEVDE